MGKKYDLIELKCKPARISESLHHYYPIYSMTEGRLVNTGVCARVQDLKILKDYPQLSVVPIFNEPELMNFFKEYGWIRIQILTAIWEINERKL